MHDERRQASHLPYFALELHRHKSTRPLFCRLICIGSADLCSLITLAQSGVHVLRQRHQLVPHVVFALQRGAAAGEGLVPVTGGLAAEVVLLLQLLEIDVFAHHGTSEIRVKGQ